MAGEWLSGDSSSPDTSQPERHGLSRIFHDIATPFQKAWTGLERSKSGFQGDIRVLTSPETYTGAWHNAIQPAMQEFAELLGPVAGQKWLNPFSKNVDPRYAKMNPAAQEFHDKGGLGGAARFIQHDPIMSMLVPGGVVAGQATTPEGRKQIGEHPLLSFLDVMPIVKEAAAGTWADKAGTDAAAKAVEAGATPAEAAKIGRAVAKKTAKHPFRYGARKVRGQAADWAEQHPEAPLHAADIVKHLQTGKTRDFIRQYGQGGYFQRKADYETAQWLKGLKSQTKDFERQGLSRERMVEISELRRAGAPGWKESVTDPIEASFVRTLEEHVAHFRQLGIGANQLFDIGGEIWNKSEAANINRLTKRIGDLSQRVGQLRQQAGLSSPEVAQSLLDQAKKLEVSMKASARSLRRQIPTRWYQAPEVQRAIAEKLRTATVKKAPESVDEITKYIENKNFEALRQYGMTNARISVIARDAAKTFVDLKARGFDPGWMHNVGVEKAEQTLMRPKINPKFLSTTSDVMSRSWFSGTYEKDPWISIGSQGAEWIMKENTHKALLDMEQRGWLMTRDALVKKVQPYLQRLRAAAQKAELPFDEAKVQDELVARDHMPFDAREFFPTKRIGGSMASGTQFWIPKSMYHTIESLQKSLSLKNWEKISGMGTKLYATDVLKLSPRYYLHVPLASAMALMGRTDPLVFRFARDAFRITRDGNLEGLLPGGGMITAEESATALYHAAGGGTIHRLLSKIDSGMGKYSTFVHDMTQAMGYLYGEDQFLHELKGAGVDVETGLSKKMAQEAGVEFARRLVPQWDSFMPIERTLMRTAFPFYGFSSFLMRYVLSYPFDHPLRAYVISNLAQKELDDWNTKIPQTMMSLLFIGKPDATGKQMGIPFTSAMPFLSVSNMFTMSGVYARLNPGIQATFQALWNIDPNKGSPDLFPGLDVDPTTGNLMYHHKTNPLSLFAEQYMPQFQSLEQVMGWSQDMKALKETDPELWRSMLFGNLGITLPEKVDPDAIQARIAKNTEYVGYLQQKEAARQARQQQGQGQTSSGGTGGWLTP